MTRPRQVEIIAGSRLHFGMFGWGQPKARCFGGVGLMVDQPALRLVATVRPAAASGSTDSVVCAPTGETPLPWQSHEVLAVVERLRRCADQPHDPAHSGTNDWPAVEIQLLSAPPRHAGLGSGTQLHLALAAALTRLAQRPLPEAVELARWTGRGRRSAIGLYGFSQGGLLVEGGKLPGEALSPLVKRVALPAQWRWVLLSVGGPSGLSGEAELRAFDRLPPVPRQTTEALERLTYDVLLPAVRRGDIAASGEALEAFGRLAGGCFAAVQGGVFASANVAALAQAAREAGARGVAQSSWGPTLAALVGSADEAFAFVERLQHQWSPRAAAGSGKLEAAIACPLNHGAVIA